MARLDYSKSSLYPNEIKMQSLTVWMTTVFPTEIPVKHTIL